MGNSHKDNQPITIIVNEEDISLDKPISNPKELNNKSKTLCPTIGLGTALIKNEKDANIVYQSIKDGVRLIDVIPYNEEIVGIAIENALKNNIINREDLFIVTKLEIKDKENPEKALRESLKRLKLEYVDLYLESWPTCKNYNEPKKYKLIPVRDTWKEMEKLVDLGLTRTIGVCNYNIENLLNIISICRIKPVVNEVEFNPYLNQKDLKEFCDLEGIKIFAYNPLVKGEYCDRNILAEKNLDLFRENTIYYLNNQKKYQHLTKGQIILNWHMSLGVIPIPGTSKVNRMKENLKATTFTLSKRNIDLIGSYEDKKYRSIDGRNIFGINIFA